MLTSISDGVRAAGIGGIRVRGWVKTSLLDYPGKIASTLFLEGCNFRCPYCHNPDLVVPAAGDAGAPDLPGPEQILSYLETYRRLLEGVCISGGEPLLEPGLADLCGAIRNLGLEVKVDTNGSLPGELEVLVRRGVVNYVAVDIKGPPGKISAITGARLPEEALVLAVEKTVNLLRKAAIPHELRTTVVPGLIEPEDLLLMAQWLQDGSRFVLQQFRPDRTLDPSLRQVRPHPPEVLRQLARDLSGFFSECSVRGAG